MKPQTALSSLDGYTRLLIDSPDSPSDIRWNCSPIPPRVQLLVESPNHGVIAGDHCGLYNHMPRHKPVAAIATNYHACILPADDYRPALAQQLCLAQCVYPPAAITSRYHLKLYLRLQNSLQQYAFLPLEN